VHLHLGAQRAGHVRQSADRLLIFGAMYCEHSIHAVADAWQFELQVLVMCANNVLHDSV
jgi:hypothetical protein